jgi:FkbM family methyltransferase
MRPNSPSFERRLKRLIPTGVKSWLVATFAEGVGRIVQTLGVRRSIHGATFPFSKVTPAQAGLIFLEVWESAEIKLSRKYLKLLGPLHVIELGGSMGTNYSANHRSAKSWTLVEPIPKNLQLLEHVIVEPSTATRAMPVAYHSSRQQVRMTIAGNEASQIKQGQHGGIDVPCYNMSRILSESLVPPSAPFALITDIEGAEVDLLQNDIDSLSNCTLIVAELENTPTWSIEDQVAALREFGYDVGESYGNVFVFLPREGD